MQEIFVQKVPVVSGGQVHYFQVNIPANVARIIGIEVSLRTKGPSVLMQWQTGMLTLQAAGKMGFCYNAAVINEPLTTIPYDLGLTMIQAGFVQPDTLLKDAVAQHTCNEPDPVNIPNCRLLYGVYRDGVGVQMTTGSSYELVLAFWTEVTING
jgi:hypothetical protein